MIQLKVQIRNFTHLFRADQSKTAKELSLYPVYKRKIDLKNYKRARIVQNLLNKTKNKNWLKDL